MPCISVIDEAVSAVPVLSHLPSIGWHLVQAQAPERGGQSEDIVLW